MRKLLSTFVSHLSIVYKFMTLVVTVALLLLMFPQKQQSTHYNYSIGSFWKANDVYAPYDFTVRKSQEEVDKAITVAKSQTLLYYHSDSSAHAMARKALFESHLSRAEKRQLKITIDSIYEVGYIEVPHDLPDIDNHTLVLLEGNIGSEHAAKDFITPLEIDNIFLRDSILIPNIRFDATRTQLELDSRLSQANYTSQMISAGELIIAKGELVSKEKAQIIKSLEEENDVRFASQYNTFNRYLGQGLLSLIAFIALFLFLKNTQSEILADDRKVTFVFTIILMMAGIVALLLQINPEWVLIAPLCIAPILMCVFFDMRVALYVHLAIVTVLGNIVPNSFEFIFYQLIAGMMSIIVVRNFEKRSNFFLISGIIFLTYSLIYTCGMLSQDTNLHNIQWQRYLLFLLNSTLTLLAYPLIYIFEKMFRMTTDLTLQEIASINTPALRELSRKAPGTFQHSMQVANLSEDIVDELGGNALLARVGGLYHDIGKSNAPLYFTENQNTNYNPHNDISYEESAAIITQHVLDGIELAKQYRLPDCVVDFIRTHHGTTKTGYFYTKYMNEHPNGGDLDESAFSYPGPRPFSLETAVVMLVDSVEAACKSLKNPSKEDINNLVDKIIDGKIENEQLSNCDITFKNIDIIRKKLKEKMHSIYHVRVAYPVMNNAATTEKKEQ